MCHIIVPHAFVLRIFIGVIYVVYRSENQNVCEGLLM